MARCMQSLTTTVNSSVSFSVRESEMRGWDEIFSTDEYPKYQGGRETGTLGPDAVVQPELWHGTVVQTDAANATGAPANANTSAAYAPNIQNRLTVLGYHRTSGDSSTIMESTRPLLSENATSSPETDPYSRG